MAYPSLAALNKRIAIVAPNVELIRGEGYHYFIFDDGTRYESRSEMIPYTNHMVPQRWLDMAVEFRRAICPPAAA